VATVLRNKLKERTHRNQHHQTTAIFLHQQRTHLSRKENTHPQIKANGWRQGRHNDIQSNSDIRRLHSL